MYNKKQQNAKVPAKASRQFSIPAWEILKLLIWSCKSFKTDVTDLVKGFNDEIGDAIMKPNLVGTLGGLGTQYILGKLLLDLTSSINKVWNKIIFGYNY